MYLFILRVHLKRKRRRSAKDIANDTYAMLMYASSNLWTGFSKNLSVEITMSGQQATSKVNL